MRNVQARWVAIGVATAWLVTAAGCAHVSVRSGSSSADAPSAPDATDLAAAKADIQPMFQQMLVAANHHDTDAHLAAYERSPDIVFVANDQEIHGWDALREQQRKWWQDGKSDAVYEVIGAPEYSMPSRGVVLQTYFLSSRRTAPDGSAREARIGVSAVWKQLPGGWRIVYAHESVVAH